MRRLLGALTVVAVLAATGACSDDDGGGDVGPAGSPSGSASTGSPDGETLRSPTDGPTGAPEQQLPQAPPVTERFVPARTPRELATRLTVAEDLARASADGGEVRRAAAFETQLLYRQLARRPAWEERVRAAVPRRYRADVSAHVHARRSLRSLHTTLTDELPAWRIAEPAPLADLLRFYRKGERVHGVPWEVLAAINLVETGFGRIRGVSSAGAQGPMQFIPSTWAAYGEGDVDDPHDAILAAARYLAASGGAGGRDGLEDALYSYNNHSGYVAGILAYASVLERDPQALRTLSAWQIIYLSTIGDLWLPVGYDEERPVPVRRYARQHPERHLGTATD
ncbi:transglycosylase SLT domain-containing protein [Nocardioides sp. TF02-7]|uniref:lytic transglycosylase domain-containing protein n=1 Tax=Nocardioides sp. TF02-7 TaxID=2917724 RepID=UPI001F059D61|nr:transglycosylase SLT domain-containing protein [Nocardioides sp. TF02-7]UMG91990.1 transglycosylase SLT domain-containing protein [Nocardioides sp. TF02-7]